MRHIRVISFVLITAILGTCELALAAVVRGRLLRGQGSAPGIAVTVWSQQLGRSQPTYSQVDGMYYMPSVPAGFYTLEVWAGGGQQAPLTFNIQVNEPGTDIPPIFVP
jgi:hypothetical protein